MRWIRGNRLERQEIQASSDGERKKEDGHACGNAAMIGDGDSHLRTLAQVVVSLTQTWIVIP